MSLGLPDTPVDDDKTLFVESEGDTCPTCGWDTDDARQDPHAAYATRALLAVEKADGSVYGSMGGAENLAFYWRCPTCNTPFTTEEETTLSRSSLSSRVLGRSRHPP